MSGAALPMLAGALAGLGFFVLFLALRPARPSLAVTLARLEASRGEATQSISASIRAEGLSPWRRKLGARVELELTGRGVGLDSVQSDLAVLGRSMEGFLATTVVVATLGLAFGPTFIGMLMAFGFGAGPALPLGVGLILAVLFAVIPLAALRSEAAVKRRDFRHAVGSFLDLVSMNLAGGRGVPESLSSAAQVGGGWPFARIRDTLSFARMQGLTPWAALGRLGDELDIDELRDLSAALTLVADDGAKVRQSLTARSATLRRRELAELEGKAAERSQSMLVAQLVITFGFLLFLAYPAIYSIFSANQ
ncbi:MAG: type II secretion system F family protein [Actinobacteria bacterium]|nr:type II secretion system F family protein [Actinomycetota bacterium]MBI3688035.1 type II secretion system F family protein [Actinomycetota bacterium]